MEEIQLEFKGYRLDSMNFGLSNKAGIYIIYLGTVDGSPITIEPTKILFIGASNHMGEDIRKNKARDCWMSHISDKNEKIAYSYSFYDKSDLQTIKNILVNKFKPLCNEEVKSIDHNYKIKTTGDNALIEMDF